MFSCDVFCNSQQRVAAGGACQLQASVVFRDNEIERLRLFDEILIGESEGEHEEDTEEHDPHTDVRYRSSRGKLTRLTGAEPSLSPPFFAELCLPPG